MAPKAARRVSFLAGLKEHKATLVRGASLIAGGIGLMLVGTLVGTSESKAAMLIAGTLAFSGLCIVLLAFFLYLLPPLLPAK